MDQQQAALATSGPPAIIGPSLVSCRWVFNFKETEHAKLPMGIVILCETIRQGLLETAVWPSRRSVLGATLAMDSDVIQPLLSTSPNNWASAVVPVACTSPALIPFCRTWSASMLAPTPTRTPSRRVEARS